MMSGGAIVSRLQGGISEALKGGDKPRAAVLRLLLAAIKQRQIDSGEEADEAALVAVVEKMIKQRRESIAHYEKAGRDDLRAQEQAEIDLLQPFMPKMMEEADVTAAIEEVILSEEANSVKDMGRIMALLKPRLAGRADMGMVSRIVKERLSA